MFNFFQADYAPSGAVANRGLVSPEAQILTAPNLIAFLNGAVSLFKWGFSSCDNGLMNTYPNPGAACWRVYGSYDPPQWTWGGNCTYIPAVAGEATAVVAELAELLTAGQLSPVAQETLERTYDATLLSTGSTHEALKAAQQLFMVLPEFHATNANQLTGTERELATVAVSPDPLPYKAIVYFYFDGAADSFNMLVPLSGCGQGGAALSHDQYAEVRNGVGLTSSELLPVNASGSGQPCEVFGLHPKLAALQGMYADGDAAWIANIGTLVEPITRDEYLADDGSKEYPGSLFAHNLQTKFTQNLHADAAQEDAGVLGRAKDALIDRGVSMGAYSIYGNPIVLESVTSAAYDSIGSWQGVTTFDDSDTSEELRPAINNLTAQVSTSAFSETWSSLLETTLRRTESLAEALDGVELEQPWVDNLDSEVSDMFEQVATIIKANQINIGNERDVFYVRLGGFDTHSDLTEKLADLLEEADAVRIQGLQGEVGLMRGSTAHCTAANLHNSHESRACPVHPPYHYFLLSTAACLLTLLRVLQAMASFRDEMKLQGLWDNVTIVQASEFGRTLTTNGLGTDHAWGGNTFLAGGSVKGGKIHGHFPTDLSSSGDEYIGRGRLVPTSSWEALWHAVAGWFGVEEGDEMASVLPNLGNFPGDKRLNASEVFE